MIKHTPIVILTALTLAACGGEERLSRQQLAGELQPRVEAVMAEFGAVFEAVAQKEGEARESSPVPAAALEKARAAAATERATADAIAGLRPPEALEPDVDELAAAAREQAEQIDALAGRSPTVAELADVMEGGGMRTALARLADKGVLRLPPQ